MPASTGDAELMRAEDRPGPHHARGRLEAGVGSTDVAPAPRRGQSIFYVEALDDGRTLSIGPEVHTLLGYTETEWMADPMIWQQLIHPEDRDRVVTACEAANAARRTFRAEYRMISRAGRVIRFRDEASILYGELGHPLCWQGEMVVIDDDDPQAG